ncbi:MAG TPA: ATP-dependent Clp protease adaptor ClpS [Bacteroidales bacterium]|nr:ATP-dependent Clp protease adaptor ClpS [Bacteroidales bacterium]
MVKQKHKNIVNPEDKINKRATTNRKNKKLILYNDNINTFEYVIENLVEICQHDPLQAEQCALITHSKGSCQIKHGEYEYLSQLSTLLIERGLKVKII